MSFASVSNHIPVLEGIVTHEVSKAQCPRCVGGQYIEEDDGRRVCLQCGHDPLQAFFRANVLPDVPVFKYPGGARESMGVGK